MRWVDGLTPWHFDLAGACADCELLGLLRAQLVKLAVLFTCDRARAQHSVEPDTRIFAEYRGREHIAVIPIDQRSPLDARLKELAAVLSAVGLVLSPPWSAWRAGLGQRPAALLADARRRGARTTANR